MNNHNNKILLSIRCFVYNHEPYLRQCLEGFVMQNTNFAFEAIVHDDASTDNSAAIIREYAEKFPDIIKPIYETKNLYSRHDGSLQRAVDDAISSSSKYIAICEGDDYWTDPLKLQKQVDFLESHPDYGLVYTNYKNYFQENGTTTISNCIQTSFEDEIIRNRIATLTTLVRGSLWKQYVQDIGNTPYERKWLMGDYPIWIYILANSKAKLISDVTAVYRVLKNSASHHTSYKKSMDFLLSTYDITFFFADKYNVSTEIRKTIANNEINDMLYLTKKHNTNLHFPLFKFMVSNEVFNIKKYISALLRSSVWGRTIYNHIKAI